MGPKSDQKPQICRLCLAATTISFSLTNDIKASEMLEALTSLKILPTDEISTVMCLKCSLNLKLAFTIRQNMLRAENRFKEQSITVVEEILDPDVEPISEVIKIQIENEKDPKPEQKHPEKKTKSEINNEYPCDLCGRVKSTKLALRRHKYNVHVKVKCPICSKEITQSNITHHLQRHNGDSTVCDICGVSVKNLDLRFHVRSKHENLSYKCEFCDRVFKLKRSKVDHEKRNHLNQADYMCDTCGKKFYTPRRLYCHAKAHQNLRPHICEFCKVGFSTKFALKTHRRQHTKETPFKCDICATGFRQNVSLKRHLEVEHGVKEKLTIECTVCGRGFASRTALLTHNRIHS